MDNNEKQGRKFEESDFDSEFLHTLIKSLPDLIWLKDIEGRYLICNPRFEKFFGYEMSEIKGKTDFDFLPADLAGFFRQKDREALKANRPKTNLERITFASDGHEEIVETIKTPMYDKSDNIIGVLGVARDITARHSAEDALKKSEEKYKYLFESNPVSMWIYDLDTLKFLEVNSAAQNHYGYTRAEFRSMTLKDIRPAEDINKLMEDISGTSEELNKAGIWRHVKKNGDIIYVEITSHKIIFNDKESRLVLARDVTDTVKTDMQVKKLFRAIEQSPASIMITDKVGAIEYVNPRFTALTGYSKEEVIGKNPRFLKATEEGSVDYEDLWNTISSGSVWKGEFVNADKKGKTFIEQASISPVYDDNGKITHYVAVKEDITKRKKIEENLRKFTRGIEESSDAVFMTDIEGSIEYINPAFERIYGFSKKETIGKTPRILKSGHHTIDEYRYFWETLLSGKEVKGEIKNKTKSGTIIDIEATTSPIHDNTGKLTGFLSINRDVTEKKNAQNEIMKAKEQAERADRLKTAFLHNISHEIRTPMNAIMGFAALMTEPGTTTEELEGYTESIQNGSDQLLTIINDIVAVSEVMANTAKIQTGVINLNDSIKRVARPFISQAEEKGIKFVLKPGLSDADSNLEIDRLKLTKIISNLLDNAVKFTDEGTITLNYEVKSNQILLSVSDTGIGIPAEYSDKVFENFFQVEHSLKRLNEGTGLGLTICKAYTELLGGRIWIESNEGKGTVAYFTFPYKKPSSTPDLELQTREISESTDAENIILVAEDDGTNLRLIEKLLSEMNITILPARNGEEAVQLCKNHMNIKMVLLDIKMPEMDGFQAAAQIREIKPDAVIIAQTAYVDDADTALDAGFNDFIPKPFTKHSFTSVIRKYMEK
ncbi:MAG: PAS domain S-box protein [Bacteroidales bacterium]|nr:PAS domain S-box protein [Bacteroidales bacterium]